MIKRKKKSILESSKSVAELRKRIFWILFGLLALFSGVVTILSVYRDYMDVKREVREILKQASANTIWYTPGNEREGYKNGSDPINQYTVLSELPIYTLQMSSGQPAFVFQNSDQKTAAETWQYASSLLQNVRPGESHIGNLYFDQWAWEYTAPGAFSMVDIRSLSKDLCQSLIAGVLLYAGYLVVTALFSRVVVSWLVKPIEETLKRQKQFIADASHELKTPLAVIIANSEAMEQNPDPKWMKNIVAESEKMNHLVVSMLDLARSEEETLMLERVNLSMLTEKECLMQEAVFYEKNLMLETEIEEDLWVKADKTKAAQLITILLDNAQKHANSTIRVSLKKEGKNALLKVMNDGDPIAPEDREHIFERFYRADKSRARKSGRYGLGLAIAKNIAVNHQSKIWADSKDGWTEFCWKMKLENSAAKSA